MSTRIEITVGQEGISSYGGRSVVLPGSLTIEVDPTDVRAGHGAIQSLADRAHDELRLAVERIYDQRRAEVADKEAQLDEARGGAA